MSGTDFGPITKEQQDVANALNGVMQQATIAEALGPLLSPAGRAYSEEAKGFLENARYQFDAAGKALADGAFRLGTNALRIGFNVGRMGKGLFNAPFLGGSGNMPSWTEANAEFGEAMRYVTGSEDPGALDWTAGLFQGEQGGLSVGDRADREIQARLGNMAVLGEGIGAIASFAIGPGGMLGKETANLVRPMTMAVERAAARRIAKGAIEGADPAVVGQLLRSGQPLRALAQLPEWQQQAGKMTKLLAWGGRSIDDLLSTTAAMTAQSYAMSDYEHQGSAAMMALLTAPLTVPIARLGQKLASRISTAGLTEGELKAVGDIYNQVARGRLSPSEADAMIRGSVSSAPRRALANVVSSAFEGSAFTWMHEQSWKDMGDWLDGDSEAGARLFATWAGSAAGIAMTKFAVPGELAPLFAHVRPDLNSLRIHAEAEAIRRRPKGWTGDAMAARAERMDRAGQGPWQGPVDPSAPVRQTQNTEWSIPIERDVAMYDWAEVPTRGLLGGGFRPVWRDGEPLDGSRVRLLYGDGAEIVVSHTGSVDIPEPVRRVLEEFRPGSTGADVTTTRSVTDPATGTTQEIAIPANRDRATGTVLVGNEPLTGQQATKALDALSLLGSIRTMEGALQFGRMGFREVQPGVWANDQTGEYWSMNLDGSSTRRTIDGKDKAREMLAAVDGFGEPQFQSEALDVLQHMALNHRTLAPDAMVDSVLTQAVMMAQTSESVGGNGLRALFSSMKPEEVAANLTKNRQDFFAAQLGMLGSGQTNAVEVAKALRTGLSEADWLHGILGRASTKRAKTAAKPETQTPTDAAAPVATPEPQGPPPAPPSIGEQIAAVTPTAHSQMADIQTRGRIERIAMAAEERGDADLASRLRSIMETGTPEQMRAAIEEHGTGYVGSGPMMTPRAQRRALEKAKVAGQSALDWFSTDRVERIGSETNSPEVTEWAAAMGRARSEERRIYGEAQTAFRAGEKALRKMGREAIATVDVNGTPMYRWQALMEGRIEPANANERAAADGLRNTALRLWNEAAAAGVRRVEQTSSGELEWVPIHERDKAVMPRMKGSDWDAIYSNQQSREALFQWLIDRNNLRIRDPETRQLRDMTVADMTEQWLDRMVGSTVSRAERNAAFEFVRQLREVPAMWQGMHLLESNPFDAMRKLMHGQAGRVATVREWGQDLPEAARAAITARGETLRPGAEEALRSAQRALVRERGPEGHGNAKMAEDVLVTLQGGAPYQLHPFMRALAPYEGAARASTTAMSFIHDIPAPFVQGPAYAGIRRMARAMAAVVRSPREHTIASERAGVLLREMGSHDFREAEGLVQKATDLMAWASTKSERGKVVVFDRMAVEMLNDWGRGRVTGNDRDVVRDMLRIPEEVGERLLSGGGTDADKLRFRHEFVKLTSGRRTQVEGSQFVASPNLQKLIRYGNWITGRTVEIRRAIASIVRPDATPAQRARAMMRAAGLTAGWTASGMVTPLISYLIYDLFRGQDGFDRWLKEVSYAPGQMALRGLSGQVTGGPVAAAGRALTSDKAKDWAQLTSITTLGYAVAEAISTASAATPVALGKAAAGLASDYGILPRAVRDLGATVAGGIAGEDKQTRLDARMIASWERMAGIERPEFVRNKAPEFYDALARIRSALQRSRGEPQERVQQVLREAEDDIRQALSLAPEESVAATVRSFQHLDGRSPEQRAELQKYVADDSQMQRIYAHDLAMRELASALGRMHGENPAPLDRDLELVESQARLGDSSQWGKLVDRALEDATLRIMERQPIGSELRDVADSMAAFPDQLSTILSPRQLRSLTRPHVTYAYRARMLQTILERRARDRAQKERRER